MTTGLDIVTNDAGELVRRAHARDMGEEVVVALHRLLRLVRVHDVENQAFSRQLEECRYGSVSPRWCQPQFEEGMAEALESPHELQSVDQQR